MTDARLVLALDTATEVTVVALGRCTGDAVVVLDSEEIDAPRSAMSLLLPTVASLLERNRYELREIDEIVCGRGPGSFTGVRIGVATAKGLAHGLGVPLAGVRTLDAVAWRFSGTDTLVGVVGDAMRGEVYPALYRCGSGRVERLSEDSVTSPGAAAEGWLGHRGEIVLAGNGLAKYAGVFSDAFGADAIADEALWKPSGQGLLVARASGMGGGAGAPSELLPVYTRLSDAEENERKHRESNPMPPGGVAGGPA